MSDNKFFFSWLICTLVMLGASYAWHGLFLNDLIRLDYSINLFYALAATAYVVLGFFLTVAIYYIKSGKNSYINGLAIGGGMGLLVYFLAFVFGISFNSTIELEMILVDATWQVFEQSIGGLVCGLVYRFLFLREGYLARA